MTLLALAFLLVAFLYASVGFGGGSTYTALLIESGLAWELVPPVSLLCNIVVVTGGVWHFARAGHLDLRFAGPLVATSVPAAFLGGYVPLAESTFLGVLGGALLLAGILLVVDVGYARKAPVRTGWRSGAILTLGAALGGLAGVTGIGGGIYLAPVLHILRLADARTVAATCSLFILVNSLSGLWGQLLKLGGTASALWQPGFLLLPFAVFAGGQLGSRLGAAWLPVSPIRRLTGVVITLVALRLLWQVLH